ncbi:RagB/SusD family nutrient uptake outer membrane protein [Pedobacter sp. MC2016-14]|uniref:RagB/SusD family nutrient uptake outer membrane protein n=1 Tax=Pedobacter sp. MC2016-14 TaxID=2897327 RepID=UPI001E5167C6|nr:RagB/SusD family nutrient uptake outer membrane protein [Pedobacter sp. MC2016-14]MCD0488097.1 RagB/SusD family nutrient uptake outer membrane protein [Pedobacter sp. MC2016-14]
MKAKIFKFTIGLFAIVFMGCEKMIEINSPLNETPSAGVYTTDKIALSALSGMYGRFSQTSFQTTGLPVYTSLMADDLRYLATVTAPQEYNTNTYTALTASAEPFTEFYQVIYRTNAIIEGLTTYAGTSAAINKQLIAEAKLMRGYAYFILVNFYGEVPLVLQTDANVTAYLPRETVANIYKQIISDLIDAKANLRSDYSFTNGDRLGVNKFTAAALLARVYLYTGNYSMAEENSTEVIQATNLYTMVSTATMGTALFVKNSSESIWQLPQPVSATNQYTVEGSVFLPSSNTVAALFYQLQPSFLSIFTGTDRRRTLWMRDLTIAGNQYVVPAKFKYRTHSEALAANVTESQIILRLAEQYLIRAEARVRIGTNISGALTDLNVTRLRADIPALTTTNPSVLLDEIALEYRKEFFCEQAFRWFNLKRTGQADVVLPLLKPTWKPEAKFYPIAQSIINNNPNLIK